MAEEQERGGKGRWRAWQRSRKKWLGAKKREQRGLFEDLLPGVYHGPWGDVLFALEELRGSTRVAEGTLDTAICWATGLAEGEVPQAPFSIDTRGGVLFVWHGYDLDERGVEGDEVVALVGLGIDGADHGWLLRPLLPSEEKKAGNNRTLAVECYELTSHTFWNHVPHLHDYLT